MSEGPPPESLSTSCSACNMTAVAPMSLSAACIDGLGLRVVLAVGVVLAVRVVLAVGLGIVLGVGVGLGLGLGIGLGLGVGVAERCLHRWVRLEQRLQSRVTG